MSEQEESLEARRLAREGLRRWAPEAYVPNTEILVPGLFIAKIGFRV